MLHARLKLFGAATLVFALPLLAHHPFADEFDGSKPVTLNGTIKSVEWTEPHVMITMNVTSGAPAGDWKLEAASPAALGRMQFTQAMLKEGDRITVQGYRALDGSMSASARSVRLPDGRTLSVSDPNEDKGPAPQLTSGTKQDRDPNVLAQNRPDPAQQPRPADELPATASNLPLIGALGVLALAGGLVMRRARLVRH